MVQKIKLFKNFTYYSMIKEAIYHAPHTMATSNNIFTYFVAKHPELFKQSNSMTWKGNIRQVLSKNPEFVKVRKMNNSKQHFWTHKPIEMIEEEEIRLSACLQEPARKQRFQSQPHDGLCESREQDFKDNKVCSSEVDPDYRKAAPSCITSRQIARPDPYAKLAEKDVTPEYYWDLCDEKLYRKDT